MGALREADRYTRSLPSVRAERVGWRWQSAPGFYLGEGAAFTELVPFAEVDASNPLRQYAEHNGCFWNATNLILSGQGRFRYCEGYAMRGVDSGAAVHHAWAVDEAGRVWDTTWARDVNCNEDPEGFVTLEEGRFYHGLTVAPDVLVRWLEGTGRSTLMIDRRWSSRMLLRYGLAEGLRRGAHLADQADPEWLGLQERLSEAVGQV